VERVVIVDTHVWLLAAESPEKLGRRTREMLENPSVAFAASPVSVLEFAQLAHRERIRFHEPIAHWVARTRTDLGWVMLEMTESILLGAYDLMHDFHGDPADRILVSTARHHNASLLTLDRAILSYPGVRTLDAGE
jgi:PIN domain nuclease of toxin-antitoxin system